MTTFTIILITWFIAGLLANVLVIYETKQDIIIEDFKLITLTILLGYLSLIVVILIFIADYITLPKFKLPYGDKVIWKYPKKN